MGAGAFSVTVAPKAYLIFPLRDDDLDLIFGDSQEDFQDFNYSPFTVHQTSDDDEAPITKGKFKTLNEKLDTLLESSKSSSKREHSFEVHKTSLHLQKQFKIPTKLFGKRLKKSKN